MKTLSRILAGLFLAGMLTSCGGGTSTSSTAPPQPTRATLKLSLSGTLPQNTLIGGVDVTVNLPAGVTVMSTVSPPETDAGVVSASGVASGPSTTLLAVYTQATSTVPGHVKALTVNVGGFGTGEFNTINCRIAGGYYPRASDFSISPSATVIKDLNGVIINGLTPGFTADIR